MAVKKNAPKKRKKNIPVGIAYIKSTHNNTIITFTDLKGDTIAWASGGTTGTKNSKKSTPFTASLAAASASDKAKADGIKEVSVIVKGTGPGKDSARKQIEVSGIKVTSVKDITPIPHNGTRPPRRVIKALTARK